ncbi:MAG TPA: MoaD/ThiS family protein, partial [Flavobacteriales bacterium]|nr:MoaD/ThiS family protein [Flavobacteriales bacterium]
KASAQHMELNASTLNELRALLIQRIPDLEKLSYAIAVDRRMVHVDMALSGAEEIAVLPPFAGG